MFWIAGIVVFGPELAFGLSYVGHLIGHTANYFIAKKWGRPAVIKVAGKDSLTEIDKFAKVTKPFALFLIKLVGGAATDYISYAAGLARISYISHIVTTAFGILPMMLLGFWIISSVGDGNLLNAVATLGIFYVVNYSSTLLLIPIFWYVKK